ncbi:hypothetical protein HHK36_007871 [Tetracentron sinense]|uniref:Uncharacterized protein n=1 Tax=Tetracentron sinense TaxID=13715 RepID=A0A834ZEL0_TETSI|nr:hypothetical protein HHK36_007871 [Tetracentron sinense]
MASSCPINTISYEPLEEEDNEENLLEELELGLSLGCTKPEPRSSLVSATASSSSRLHFHPELGLGLGFDNEAVRNRSGRLSVAPPSNHHPHASSLTLVQAPSWPWHMHSSGFLRHENLQIPVPKVHDYSPRPETGLWFSLRSSINREGKALPQISKAYIRVKDEKVTVFMVKTYLVRKLGLSNEVEGHGEHSTLEEKDLIAILITLPQDEHGWRTNAQLVTLSSFGLWREIDFRRPNPMECAVDIHNYNIILQEDRVYAFLDGLDDRLDKIRGDVLQLRPFPTVGQAYAHVSHKALRQAVMITGSADAVPGAVLATKGLRLGSSAQPPTMHNEKHKPNTSSEGLKCSHCGHPKHTRETCFKLHGYPDWWNDLQAKKGRDTGNKDEGSGKAVVATAEPQVSFTPQMALVPDSGNCGCVCYTSTNDDTRGAWLLDSGATDHMTFAATDFTQTSLPRRTNIANANGVISRHWRGHCDTIPYFTAA